jgi:hypothetical protein
MDDESLDAAGAILSERTDADEDSIRSETKAFGKPPAAAAEQHSVLTKRNKGPIPSQRVHASSWLRGRKGADPTDPFQLFIDVRDGPLRRAPRLLYRSGNVSR